MQVYKLGPLEPLNTPSESVVSSTADSLPDLSKLEPVDASVYIWTAPIQYVISELWSYEVFMRNNAWAWVGPSEAKEEYAEVDRRREMNGIIEKSAAKAIQQQALN